MKKSTIRTEKRPKKFRLLRAYSILSCEHPPFARRTVFYRPLQLHQRAPTFYDGRFPIAQFPVETLCDSDGARGELVDLRFVQRSDAHDGNAIGKRLIRRKNRFAHRIPRKPRLLGKKQHRGLCGEEQEQGNAPRNGGTVSMGKHQLNAFSVFLGL